MFPVLCPLSQVDDSVEALDAAAVEAALSLCEEAVSEGHTLPGPWETQELKPAEPPVQHSSASTSAGQENQDASTALNPSPSGLETQNPPDVKGEEPFKGTAGGAKVAGGDINSWLASDEGATGSEVKEEGAAMKEAEEATIKSEAEECSQPEANPPCLGGETRLHMYTKT